jgi:hypothetical protein
MCRLAERLFPEKGVSVLGCSWASNICTLEVELPGDKRGDKTYKPLLINTSNSDSKASLTSITFDEKGNKVVTVGKVSVQQQVGSFVAHPLPRIESASNAQMHH